MFRTLTAVLATGAIAIFAAGCGDDEEDTTSAAPAETTEQTTPPAEGSGGAEAPAEEGAAGGDVTVAMKGIRFQPEEVTVSVGDTVTWENQDPVEHDADARSGEFETELIGEGETLSYTTEKPGTIEYFCSVHPGMDGTINVTE